MELNIKRINRELDHNGWDRTQYAKRLKVSKQLLNYYLSNNVKSFSIVEKLAKPLGISPKDLIK